jgi:hypothetical protein
MSVSELRTAAAPKKIPTAAELVGLARTLAPKLRERALSVRRAAAMAISCNGRASAT